MGGLIRHGREGEERVAVVPFLMSGLSGWDPWWESGWGHGLGRGGKGIGGGWGEVLRRPLWGGT